MKNRIQLKKYFFYIGCITAFFFLASCTKKIIFQTSSVVPAAEGTVKVKKDDNNNYAIQIKLSNLSEPSRLQPPMKTYVVWMETADTRAKNIGQVNSSSSLLSKRLTASFETVSSIKPTRLFITAEEDGAVQYPGLQVLTTANF